jgi:hypothetical protein
VIAAEVTRPGDVVVFAAGRTAQVAAVSSAERDAGPGLDGTRYVTLHHSPSGIPAGCPVPVVTVCLGGTPVGLLRVAAPAAGSQEEAAA